MRTLALLLLAAAFAMMSTGHAMAGKARVFVVQGIPGQDIQALGLPVPDDLPVDVPVNGACALQGYTFGEIVGPIDLPAPATYAIEIGLADPDNPCGNDPVIKADVPLLCGQTASIVAHLTEKGLPTASAFNDDVSEPDEKARVAVHHTAAAPAVDVIAQRNRGKNSRLEVEGLENGDQAVAEIRPGRYKVQINPAGEPDPVFGPVPVEFPEEIAYFIDAVGPLDNATFDLLTLVIDTDDFEDDDDDEDD